MKHRRSGNRDSVSDPPTVQKASFGEGSRDPNRTATVRAGSLATEARDVLLQPFVSNRLQGSVALGANSDALCGDTSERGTQARHVLRKELWLPLLAGNIGLRRVGPVDHVREAREVRSFTRVIDAGNEDHGLHIRFAVEVGKHSRD